jgi:putative transposase
VPRRARIVLSNYPHHIVQRGHNRKTTFFEREDYRFYLDNLAEWKAALGCRLYAYCLMPNHVHLVIDPGEHGRHLGMLMKRVAGRQTRRVNKRESRSGTLWESRFKSSLIETDRYLLACCRYVEMNPVRAGMANAPEEYPWSSFGARAGLKELVWLDQDPCYKALGENAADRARRYRAWVCSAVPDGEWGLMRRAVRRGQLTGDETFCNQVSRRVGRSLSQRGPGRPPAQ